MPADIVIRGGTVVDGTGAPGRVADVAIADGVIREIGPNLHGDVELDASGCVVAPGFIDIHTHYDAQVFWDPALRPTSYHGITTVIAGNCGFAIAPTRPEHRDVIVHTLENVEDMDPATLVAGVVWDFETFPEYLDSVQRRGTTLNFTAYVGHSPLRLYVMGDAAYERAATPDEIDACARSCARASPRAARDSRRASRTRTAASTASRCRAASPKPTRSRRCSSPRAKRARAWCSSRPARSAPTPTCTSGSHASGGRSRIRCSRRRAASTSNRSRCTSRRSLAARRCGRRSRPARSRCSSRWPTRTASTPARCSAS